MGVKILDILKKTPLHPQWFAFCREERNLRQTCERLNGVVLDIGCADGKPRSHLPEGTEYIGLDYFDTATRLYHTRPNVFGDAQKLPLADSAVDHVLLLDVLEHIPNPDQCLAEIRRVLKPDGTLTIQVPFLYPIHDAPLDFHRWTRFGLERAARLAGLTVSEVLAIGHPLETAALGANIAASKTVLNWLADRNPLLILGVLLPPAVFLANSLSWLLARFSRSESMMPYAYRMVWTKA
ncbi:MAG TPA: class I SAM-dependent methyltransferase [Woeseiaceae bacterium]|jgi:SAM-dependent methyltransferase|nr:class I SAM-dependent methyltransferase [Woeseiaceae bacterium]